MYDSRKERIDSLERGGLRIIQNPTAPCFAVDSVLLADFVRVISGSVIVDLGTGTGIIPLLLFSKNNNCRIKAIELMPEMADMAERSVALNGLEKHIEIIQGNINNMADYFSGGEADIVTANPPYYIPGRGKVCEDPLFAAARSETAGTLGAFVSAAAWLLRPLGCFYAVERGSRLLDMLGLLRENKLFPCELRLVQPFCREEANLFLIKAVKGKQRELHLLPSLFIYEDDNVYSREMKEIYKGR